MNETTFKKELMNEIEHRFPGCIILKNDPSHIRGIPDLSILFKNKWAALETKRSKNASLQPLQDHYVDLLNKMSFARFISPDNKEEVLNELERSFKANTKR